MKDHAADIAATAKNVVLASGGVSVFGGLTANEVAAVGGLLVGFIGLIVQIYYKRKADRREAVAEARDAEYHAERMRELREP